MTAISRRPLLMALALAAGLLVLACGAAELGHTRADLTNPFLGPEYSAWLVGPISRLATPQEIERYLALHDDAQAAAFIDSFWQARKPSANATVNTLYETFKSRCAAADRLFGEAGFLGQRTDRGTILVLYGAPIKTTFQVSPAPQDPAIEVWLYARDAPPGLDGKQPAPRYRFIKRGELTVTYNPIAPQPRPVIRRPSEP
jgi:GWxTD domain-containing protein